MSGQWRLIITDSEILTGVAPVCGNPIKHGAEDDVVLDCCPGPHIECWTERNAEAVLAALNETEAELCS